MQLDIGFHTDPGPRKGENQDSLLVETTRSEPGAALLIVADGMGGAQAGEQASREAVSVIRQELMMGSLPEPSAAGERLRLAIESANASIFSRAQSARELEGMGCTVVAVLILDDVYWIASVGDSRVYLVREDQVLQLTDDHTWVNARVREGVLTPEQAANHSLRHVLDRALGTRPSVEIDIRPDEFLEEGDMLVLCTDGLYGVLDDQTIADIASRPGAQEAAEKLVAEALAADTHDNVSVIVLQVAEL